MKTRIGFVSNSSSSSFIIGFKEKPKNEKDFKEKIAKIFTLPKTSIYYNISKEVIDLLYSRAEEYSIKKYFNDYSIDLEDLESDTGQYPTLRKIYKNDYILYEGSVSDEDPEPGEYVLVTMNINYEDDNIVMWKEAYY